MTAILEWATDSPWWAFLWFVVALTTLENIYKYTAKRLWKVGKWEEALREQIAENTRLGAKLALAEQELERYKELYRATERATNEWEYRRRRQEEAARQANDWSRFHGDPLQYEDILRAKEAMERQAKANFNQRLTQEEQWQKIKAEYRKHMKANHPDKVRARGGSEAEIAEATKMTQKLNADFELAKKRFGK